MTAQIDVTVTQDRRWSHDPQAGPYYIPGGGVYAGEGALFNVRQLTLAIIPNTATDWLADGQAVLPQGLLFIAGANAGDFTGKTLRITIEEVAP